MKFILFFAVALTLLTSCVSMDSGVVSAPYRMNGSTMVGHDLDGNTILFKTEADAFGNPVVVKYNLGRI